MLVFVSHISVSRNAVVVVRTLVCTPCDRRENAPTNVYKENIMACTARGAMRYM